MPLFSYTARNANGDLIDGTIDAISLQEAQEALKNMNLQSEEIHERTQSEYSLHQPPPEKKSSIWEVQDSEFHNQEKSTSSQTATYFPILDTLRLYAGWLVAWYCLVFAIGSYQYTRELPFRIPYVEGLFLSPLVLSFTLAAFIFLFLSAMHQAIGSSKKRALIFTVIGVAIFWVYRINVV